MTRIIGWLDEFARRMAEWLSDSFPSGGALALAGNAIAGLPNVRLLLPVDRRLDTSITKMAGLEVRDYGIIGGGSTDDASCGFWAYCHMSGQPCVWCGGKNDVRLGTERKTWKGKDGMTYVEMLDTCPTGKTKFRTWYGCCRDPGGIPRVISFRDCCGWGFCAPFWKICDNWPEAKNWCAQSDFPTDVRGRVGPNSYYCTVVSVVRDYC